MSDPAPHVRDLLRLEIQDRAERARLPDERDLMHRFRQPRAVVRDALEMLAQAKLLHRLRGVGTVHAERHRPIDIGEYHGLRADAGSWVPEVNAEIEEWRFTAIPDAMRSVLSVEPDETECLLIGHRVWWRGVPYAASTHYVRRSEALRLDPSKLRTDWFEFFGRSGLEIGRTTIEIQASVADRSDAEIMGLNVGDPVMITDGTTQDTTGATFDFSTVRARGDYSRISSVHIRRASGASGSADALPGLHLGGVVTR